jgi:ABC-type phosphate/phosphonate transport system substrate-binding protein
MIEESAQEDAQTTDVPSGLIAALPMYDLPQLKSATDAFWRAIARRLDEAGLHVPRSLTRTDDYRRTWRHSRLIFGQACGYPVVKQLKDAVQIVATPIYSSPGCEAFKHSSFFVVSAKAKHQDLSDLRGSVCAVNSFDSNTGMNLLRAAVAPLAKGRFFHAIIVTGAHQKSLEAVAAARADVAAVDCVSFAHFERFNPRVTSSVRIIGQSLRTAAPPYITAKNTDRAILRILREALGEVAKAPNLRAIRSALKIDGFAFETDDYYQDLLRIEENAAMLGYARLC